MKIINKDTYYIGVNDHKIDLFEGQYIVPNGMAYNSYIIKDKKIAIFDTVDKHFKQEWLNNIKEVLGSLKPDYLIIQHMEPDHSANIVELIKIYPEIVLVGNAKTFIMLKQFFRDYEFKNLLTVKEGDILNLGNHILNFIEAPMVHWPEVMVTYDSYNKSLFSADGFGKFGALDIEEEWDCEARRYYFGIVGKYGFQVQNLLKKAKNLDIKSIYPLHGPMLENNLQHYLSQYNTWSSYGSETDGVAIFYTSVYGHTKDAAIYLKNKLEEYKCKKVAITDLAREDMAEAVEDAFRYSHIVLATTTYNMSIFPYMNSFVEHLVERGYQNKIIGLIQNGTWAPNAIKVIKTKFSGLKNITYIEPEITILSSLSDDNKKQLDELAKTLINN